MIEDQDQDHRLRIDRRSDQDHHPFKKNDFNQDHSLDHFLLPKSPF
jgi:hypothetical protein